MKIWIRPFIVLVIAFISMLGALFVTHPALIIMFWFSPLVIIVGYALTCANEGLTEEQIDDLVEKHRREKSQKEFEDHIKKATEVMLQHKLQELDDEWRRIVEEDGKRDK